MSVTCCHTCFSAWKRNPPSLQVYKCRSLLQGFWAFISCIQAVFTTQEFACGSVCTDKQRQVYWQIGILVGRYARMHACTHTHTFHKKISGNQAHIWCKNDIISINRNTCNVVELRNCCNLIGLLKIPTEVYKKCSRFPQTLPRGRLPKVITPCYHYITNACYYKHCHF